MIRRLLSLLLAHRARRAELAAVRADIERATAHARAIDYSIARQHAMRRR